jgi:hypothetical protein
MWLLPAPASIGFGAAINAGFDFQSSAPPRPRSSGYHWTDAEAEPRPTNANARLAIVVAVAVVSPRPIITVPDDHATIALGMPASACVVTNQSCLMKQRRAFSDLILVGGISTRGYEGTGAGEECQCQFSHVHLLSVEAPSSRSEAPTENVSTKGSVPTKLALVIDMNRTVAGTDRAKMFPITLRRKLQSKL